MKELQIKVESICLEYLIKAEKFYNKTFTFPDIKYDIRGRCAGRAIYAKNLIQLNADFLSQYKDAFIIDTVPHELAHIVARGVYGAIKPHGKDWWKFVMRHIFNLEPSVYHNYNTAPFRVRSFERVYMYNCGCRIHRLTLIRHNKIKRGRWRYCLKCENRLQFVGESE